MISTNPYRVKITTVVISGRVEVERLTGKGQDRTSWDDGNDPYLIHFLFGLHLFVALMMPHHFSCMSRPLVPLFTAHWNHLGRFHQQRLI